MKVIANALNVESSLFDKLICVLELETIVVEETSVKEASVEDKYVEVYVDDVSVEDKYVELYVDDVSVEDKYVELYVDDVSVEDKYVELYVEVYIEEIVGLGLQLSILSLNLQSETILK